MTKLNYKNYAGYRDWRLPTLYELISLIKPEIEDSDLGLFSPVFPEEPDTFLSADKVEGRNDYWVVDLHSGFYRTTDNGFGHQVYGHLKFVRNMNNNDYNNPNFKDCDSNGFWDDYYNKKHGTTIKSLRKY